MPELPEVETTCQGIQSVVGLQLTNWTIRNPNLRWPVEIPDTLQGLVVTSITRRAKYILINFDTGSLILHLGMSGRLRITSGNSPVEKHDHVDLVFHNGLILRLTDPRRFGSLHWQSGLAIEHWLLADLGPEPLSAAFTGAYLKGRARKGGRAVKNLIMDAHVVVGVGNIYANEALFFAGIRPTVVAKRLTLKACEDLVVAIRQVLTRAIAAGGTTLRDFVDESGNPGYFKQELYVYDRHGQPCKVCDQTLKLLKLGQRATVYCPKCQRAQGFVPPEC